MFLNNVAVGQPIFRGNCKKRGNYSWQLLKSMQLFITLGGAKSKVQSSGIFSYYYCYSSRLKVRYKVSEYLVIIIVIL